MNLIEKENMQQALDTVARLKAMEAEQVDKAAANIEMLCLRVEAASALNRLLKAGGPIRDLFEALYNTGTEDGKVGAAVARSVINLCELRIKEIQSKTGTTNED